MRDQEKKLDRGNVKVVIVTFENDFFARTYIADTALSWPLLIDEDRDTYKNYGMLSASFWDVWGPKTWWVYLQGVLRGQKLQKSEGDIFQRGGDVLIDPAGIVRLHHVGEGPADRPSIETVLHSIGIEASDGD